METQKLQVFAQNISNQVSGLLREEPQNVGGTKDSSEWQSKEAEL